MLRISRRLFLFVLAGSVFGWVLIAPEAAIASETDGVREVRIARLAKGINIPSWLWLNRGPVDELEERYPDTDFQLTTTPKRGGLMGDPGRVYLSQSLRSSIFLSCSS